VQEATDAHVHKDEMGDEGLMHLSTTMTAAADAGGVSGTVAKASTRGKRTEDGLVELGPDAKAEVRTEELPEVVALASGNLGLVTFPRIPERPSLEELERLYPKLVPTLRAHPGIAFLLVRSAQHGPVVIGKEGRNYVAEGRVEGEDPLAPFGPHAADKVRRTDGFPHCADIMVNSTYWSDMQEVAAFEELIGSHGGMGGLQQYPFLLVPSDFAVPDEQLFGPGAVHQQMRVWLAALGHDAYADAGTDARTEDAPVVTE
jgi:hypothetical protein